MENKKKISKYILLSFCLLFVFLFAFIPLVKSYSTISSYAVEDPNNSTNVTTVGNLLFNSDFSINQNGQDVYGNVSQYTVDDWYLITRSGANVSFNAITKVLSNSGTVGGFFLQYLESSVVNTMWGNTFTVSVKINGTVYSQTFTAPNTAPTSSQGIAPTLVCVPDVCNVRLFYYEQDGILGFTFDIFTGSVTLGYAKLEYGDIDYDNDSISSSLNNLPLWLSYTFDVDYLHSTQFWTDGNNIYYSFGTDQYFLDLDTFTWNNMSWNGLTDFNGDEVWTDGNNIYCSDGSDQYILNSDSYTWTAMSWNGLTYFNGYEVWTDGNNIYCSYATTHYILNSGTNTWNDMSWNGFNSFYGNYIWTDGNNIYYSYGFNQYILDISTNTWTAMSWNGFNSFYGNCIWTDGNNIYYSDGSYQYFLDLDTFTWNNMSWNGLTDFSGSSVFTINGISFYFNESNSGYISFSGVYNYGYELGYNFAYEFGYNQAIEDISGSDIESIYNAGYNAGYNDGVNDGNSSGYNSGYNAGYNAGYSAGLNTSNNSNYTNGYNAGYNDGYTSGVNDGNSSGYSEGYDDGYDVGVSYGYNEGVNDSNQYTFYNLFGAVLDAPVKVFSSLFNFNLLGVNLLGLITGLFTLAVIILVIKLVMGGK